jgi:hypothetical protein
MAYTIHVIVLIALKLRIKHTIIFSYLLFSLCRIPDIFETPLAQSRLNLFKKKNRKVVCLVFFFMLKK